MLEAAGDGVVWQPNITDRRAFRGSAELREGMAALEAEGIEYEAELHGLEQQPDSVVLAAGTLKVQRDGAMQEREVHWAYHFRDGRLWRQSTHASRQDALDALVALRAVASPFGIDEEAAEDGGQLVRVDGELDIATAPDLEAVLLRPRPPGERVIVDLGALRFIDSTGLRVLLRARAAARDGTWEIFVRNVPANVHRLFTIAGVQEAVPPELPSDVAG
jgi:anti-anti-sigma factor